MMKLILLTFAIALANSGISQTLPPKQAYPLDVKQIHSGHSLTDPLFNPWPGQYRYLVNTILGGTWDNIGKSTIPGSPMHWRWDNEQGLNPSARHDIADWELLVITEGIPIPSHWQDSTNIASALEHFSLYVNNAADSGNNGSGAATLLWTTWTNLDNRDGPWREMLDNYEVHWEEMMDSANANKPSRATPVYLIPGHRMMARLYDDINASLVPGITSIDSFFSDNIHVNDLGAYAVAMIHYACIYNKSPVGLPDTLFSAANAPNRTIPSPALAAYLQAMVWEVVTSYDRTGIASSMSTIDVPIITESIKVFPNPTHKYLRIGGVKGLISGTQIQILDYLGHVVYSGTSTKIDVSHLASGCYLVKAGNNVSRFVKN